MRILSLPSVHWTMPHLSTGKAVFIVATLMALVFGLDDAIGPERTLKLSARWLSSGTSFLGVMLRGVWESVAILLIVFVTCLATVPETALAATALIWFRDRTGIFIVLWMVFMIIAVALGYFLGAFLSDVQVTRFIQQHPQYLEMRVFARVKAMVEWGIDAQEREAEWPLFDRYGDSRGAPLPAVMLLVSILASLTMTVSLVARTCWLVLCFVGWLLVFAPAQGLNALAALTGAENFIKLGKYVLLLVLSIYALAHV